MAELETGLWVSAHETRMSGGRTILCGDAMDNTLKMIAKGLIQMATPVRGSNRVGEYFNRPPLVVIADNLPADLTRGTLIHEAQHWAGIFDEAVADAAIQCFPGATEDEDEADEDSDDNDGNTGSGSGGGGRIVSERQHYTLPNVWVIVWIPPRNTGGGYAGEVTVVCDYDPDTWWPDCPDMEEQEN